jgi:diaminopimelate epimerase
MPCKTELSFIKMQGAGNDYIYIDCISNKYDFDWKNLAINMSDRHFGIGSDGLILILPSDKADCRMRMFNSDGSESGMCGNALRCIARYMYESGLAKKENITIETIPGIIESRIHLDNAKVDSVSIKLPKPSFNADDLPDLAKQAPLIDFPFHVADKTLNITCVSVGNPHTVTFIDDIVSFPLGEIGPKVENDVLFPKRTNFEIVKVESRDRISVRVWERGSGETLACGSGACAAAVISIKLGLTENNVAISMLGGDLSVEWFGENITLKGPAEEVFRGTYKIQ